MAIAVDSRQVGANGSGVSSLSWSHTIGNSLSNVTLFVMLSEGTAGGPTIKSVVWDSAGEATMMSREINGKKMSQVDLSALVYVELWFIRSPQSGTKTILATFSGSAFAASGSASYSGVDQSNSFVRDSGPQITQFAISTPPSTTVTSATGDLCLESVVVDENIADILTATGGQTIVFHTEPAVNSLDAAGADLAGAATVTMSWTVTGAGYNACQICISIKPAAAVVDSSVAKPWMLPINTLGLVGWWRFQEGSGTTTVDSSGQGNTGSFSGTPPNWAGPKGLQFVANSYVDMGSPGVLKLTAAGSVSAWVYNTDSTAAAFHNIVNFCTWATGRSGYNIILKYPDFNGEVDNTTTQQFFGQSSLNVLNQWEHIMLTWDSANINYYRNGVTIASSPIAQTVVPTASVQTFRVGAAEAGTSNFIGNICDVRVYNRALSGSEVSAMYYAGSM